MKIVWIALELGEFSSGIVNHNRIFIDYLKNHPDVQEVTAVKFPLPENGVLPPLVEEIQGVRYYTPRISMDYKAAFNSILQADLKFSQRLMIKLFKLILRLKGLKRLDFEKIKKWGKIEYGLLGIASVEKPFPNPFQEQIGRCIAKLSPDIIQTHTEIIAIAGHVGSESAKGHISYQVLVPEEKGKLPPRSVTRAFYDRSDDALEWLKDHDAVDMYVAASSYVQKHLTMRGLQSTQVKVIPSPIILKQLSPVSKTEARSKLDLPQNKKIILSVGRLLERKRYVDIIQILKNLPEDVIFYLKRSVCTSDSLFPFGWKELQKAIRKNKLENRVIINSDVLPYEQMHLIYSAADVVAYPFLYEPFGMVVPEAMAAERPVIVYNSGFLPEFIKGNGFVVEPMDLDALQKKIQILLDNPALAEEMGAKGPDLVMQFDINVLGEKLLDIYREYL